jgi:hypothetical protein
MLAAAVPNLATSHLIGWYSQWKPLYMITLWQMITISECFDRYNV